MTDPWSSNLPNNKSKEINGDEDEVRVEPGNLSFEDNFEHHTSQPQTNPSIRSSNNGNEHQPLPDSVVYLQGLERKLNKLKKDSNIIAAITAKKEDCWHNLLQSDDGNNTSNASDAQLSLDEPVINGESTVNEIYRYLQPVQPLTVGETVHILEHDHLQQESQPEEEEAVLEKQEQ